ncbi:MAG: hypothetical protein ACRD8O_07110 [Bryobacteraceae bacterium]
MSRGVPPLLLASLLTLACSSSEPPIAGYRAATVDAVSLAVDLREPVRARMDKDVLQPVLGDWYTSTPRPAGGAIVDHEFQKDANSPRLRFLSLETDGNRIVTKSRKIRAILGGDFGKIYASMICDYDSSLPSSPNLFSVDLASIKLLHEPPTLDGTLPPGPTGKLTHLSAVRVFRLPDPRERLLVTAIYTNRGLIQTFHIHGSRDAEFLERPYVEQARESFSHWEATTAQHAALARYGLPSYFLPPAITEQPPSPFRKPAALQVQLDALHLPFAFDRLIAQHQFLPDGGRTTQFLTFAQVPEDEILEPRCIKRFEEQFTRRIPFSE